jgi:hypothetical protein
MFKKFSEWLEERDGEILEEGVKSKKKKKKKKWIQGAIDPSHEGFCTPMTKKTCTPRRKALAKRFKKGDLHNK